MSLFAALLVGAAMPKQESSPQPAEIDFLVIQVPDGTRGGKGRIEGRGNRPTTTDEPFVLHLLGIARECRADFPMLSQNTSHSVHIISYSTDRDREVVACLQSKMSTNFNAGIAKLDARSGFTSLDTVPFQEFEAALEHR